MGHQPHHRRKQFERTRFDHVGIITTEQRPNEIWRASERAWITDPRDHLYHVEFLRYAPDSPVPPRLQREPHVAYRVADLDKALRNREIMMRAPFDPSGTGTTRVAFVDVDGALVEFIEDWMPLSLP
jgi:hypothetical protein